MKPTADGANGQKTDVRVADGIQHQQRQRAPCESVVNCQIMLAHGQWIGREYGLVENVISTSSSWSVGESPRLDSIKVETQVTQSPIKLNIKPQVRLTIKQHTVGPSMNWR
jgi:hypothetical protein